MIASTWEAHRAEYMPGAYARDITVHGLNRDANVLQHVLANALWALGHTEGLRVNGERSTAGTCYGDAA